MGYLQYRFHEPLRFIRALTLWRTTTGAPWIALGKSIKSTVTLRYIHDSLFFLSVLDLLSVLAIGAIGVFLLFRNKRPYGVLLVAVAMFIAAAGGAPPLWLGSADRYFTTWIPVFLALVIITTRRRWVLPPLLLGFAFLQVILLSLYTQGQWAG
jgi:hypothetical protein